jgi:adenylate kinase
METHDDKEGFLIDGFPRELDQALEFEKKIGQPRLVVYFDCNLSTLEKRLLRRAQTSGRVDDNIETMRKRFETFYSKSYPVVQHYVKNQRCFTVSAEGTEDEIFLDVQRAFHQLPLYHDNIVFVLGGPGSGKGTQCVKLAQEFGLIHLSTGDLLREEVNTKSEIGQEVAGLMKEGRMVPSEILIEILRDRIAKNIRSKGFLIDGFPRSMEQVHLFESKVLYFNADRSM